MLEFSKIPGLTKIFNKDDWKKVFHACAELPNYRENKYSSYFVTTDAETRAGKLYYEKKELEKGGISYDPVSHTALTHEDDFGAGKPYELGKYYMTASVNPAYETISVPTTSTEVFESGYLYSKATAYGFSEATKSLQPSDDADQCKDVSEYYLTAQVACDAGDKKYFLAGVRYAWNNGDGEVKECTKASSTNWSTRTYKEGDLISKATDGKEGRTVYALPTYLRSKLSGVAGKLYRYRVNGSTKFESNRAYRRKLATFSYKKSEDTAIKFEVTSDEYYRAGRYYYKKSESSYVKISPTIGSPVTESKGNYVTKRYFTLSNDYSLISANEYFNNTTTYYMYLGNDIYTAAKDREYIEGNAVTENSFYRKVDGGSSTELYIEVSEKDKADAYAAGVKPTGKSWYERDKRTGFIFCHPIGSTAAGVYLSPYFLYKNGNHLYYKDDTSLYLVGATTGTLSTVTYITDGAKTWNYQIQTATDLYFKRSHVYYTDQDEQVDAITGELDLEANVRTLDRGSDYEVGQSIASWKTSHPGQNVYQHLTNFYIVTPGFVGQITHGTEFYERAGTNFPYEGFVAVATEMGAEQARGALYRCKRRIYELTEDEHHHYTGEYKDGNEESKTYYEYNSTTGEYTARTPGAGSSDMLYRNYDGSSFNQVTKDYVFQEGTVYFSNAACEERHKLVEGTHYKNGDNIADWVKGAAGRTTPYVTNRLFYYRNGWTFTPITGNRYGVTTDKRFVVGKDYFWYTGSNYEFSRVEATTDKRVKKAVIDDTVFGYHNENNDIFWGYTYLIEGDDYATGGSIADWIVEHSDLFKSSERWLYSIKNSYTITSCTDINSADIDWDKCYEGDVGTQFYKKSGSTYTQVIASYNDDDGEFYLDDTVVAWDENPQALGWYEISGNIIDKDTHITTGTFVAGKQYHYRNYAHVAAPVGTDTSITSNLYNFSNQEQKIEEDGSGNPRKLSVAVADLGTVISHKVYTRYWDNVSVEALPTYYYLADASNIRWSKKFKIFSLDDAAVCVEDYASKTSTSADPHYWYYHRGSYEVLEIAKDEPIAPKRETYGEIYSALPTYTYIGRATNSQQKIIYIDPTEEVNVQYNNRGTMITEIPICVPYQVDSTTGCNTRGDNAYGNGEEIPSSPRIYLESKNGETILPDEYYEEVYGSYYWDQFFLDHGISANPIEDVCAYFMEGSYLYMKWRDPTIMIPTNKLSDGSSESLASDSPPDAWYRTTITITDADGGNPLTVYTETTCNEFSNDFLRVEMSATAEPTSFERKLYDLITTTDSKPGGIIHLTAVSQTGTYTTYHIKPSKIVWTNSPKTYLPITNPKAIPGVTYYDYDTWKKDGSFVEKSEVYPYQTDVSLNTAGETGVVVRFTRDVPFYKDTNTAATSAIVPVVVGSDVSLGDVVQNTTSTFYFVGYRDVPEITWTELVRLGFFDQLCSAGYADVAESGVQKHTSKEVNLRVKSAGSEITIPWYTSDTATSYAKIIDTNSVIATRDIEMGYKLTEDTARQTNKTYYTRKCTSMINCWSGVNPDGSGVLGDNFEYEPWIPSDSSFTILKSKNSLYEHVTNFPHHQCFFKKTISYDLTPDATARAGVTYYRREGGQTITGVGTIETYLHAFTYIELIAGTRAEVEAGKADYVIGQAWPSALDGKVYVCTIDPVYNTYAPVNLKDPNWLISLKDPRHRSAFVSLTNNGSTYYQQIPNKEYSATFRVKPPIEDTPFTFGVIHGHGHIWGILKDDGTYIDSDIREMLGDGDGHLGDGEGPANWYKFYHEAVCEVINPVVVDRYKLDYIYDYTTDINYIEGRDYYVPGTTAGTYRKLTPGTDYTIGDSIRYTLTTDEKVNVNKRYYRVNLVTNAYVLIMNNTDYALATETKVVEGRSYFKLNAVTGEFDAVEPAEGANPSEEGWYYSYEVVDPSTAGWYEREVYTRTSVYSPMPGSLMSNQTMDRFWLPSLNQLGVTRTPAQLEGVTQNVLAPSEGSPLYYYQTKVSGFGQIYRSLVAYNTSGATVPWWCRTAVQNTIGDTATEDTTVGPYVTDTGSIGLKDTTSGKAYVFPFFTIA